MTPGPEWSPAAFSWGQSSLEPADFHKPVCDSISKIWLDLSFTLKFLSSRGVCAELWVCPAPPARTAHGFPRS